MPDRRVANELGKVPELQFGAMEFGTTMFQIRRPGMSFTRLRNEMAQRWLAGQLV